MIKLSVGQQLWFVPWEKYMGKPRYITVTKIGRVWAQTSERYRIHILTGKPYNGEEPTRATLYPDHETHARQMAIKSAWAWIRRAITYRDGPPDDVTVHDIETAMDLLRLPRPEPKT